MTTKEEFKKLFPYNGIIIEDNGQKYSLDDIWSYFQSKQQREEVIEEIKNHEFYIPQGHTTRYFKLDDKDLEFLKKENK